MTIREYLKTLLQGVKTYVDEKIVKSDWNENDENSTSYINNRTHYDARVETTKTITFDGTTEGKNAINTESGYYFVKMSDDYFSPDKLIGKNLQFFLISNSTDLTIQITSDKIVQYDGYYSINTYVIFCEKDIIIEDEDLILTKGLWFQSNSGMYVSSLEVPALEGEVKTLDEIYLPETTKYQSDWNVNDEADPAFVKNRPFYTTDPVETTIFEEQELDFNENISMSNVLQTMLIEGQIYTVICNGTSYECIARNDGYDDIYIGNQSVCQWGDGFAEIIDSDEPFFIATYEQDNWSEITVAEPGIYTISISAIEITNYKIDKKYLPDLVGKSTEGTGYVFYDDDGEEYTIFASHGAEVFNDINSNVAIGWYSHAEGSGTTAFGNQSHAEGDNTTASEYASHAEGSNTGAFGPNSHAEGYSTEASGESSHAEGYDTTASGWYSHTEGYSTTASGKASHAEGKYAKAIGDYSHAEGSKYYPNGNTIPSATVTSNTYSEVTENIVVDATIAYGSQSHAEGARTLAFGCNSHAEGQQTMAFGQSSHAEGYNTTASGNASHAEGYSTTASGTRSHVEGYYAKAIGDYSHAEGFYATASGDYSHVEGYYTKAAGEYQHVQGKWNIEDTEGRYAHIVGNGNDDEVATKRSNAHTLDWEGNAWFAGDVYVGGTAQTNSKKLSTKEYVDTKVADVLKNSGLIGNEGLVITDLSTYESTWGFITNTGSWSNINEKYQFIVIPVTNIGSVLTVTANSSTASYLAGLRSYSTPVSGVAVDFSTVEGWTARFTVPRGGTKNYNIPDDVKYLIVFTVYNTANSIPSGFQLTIPEAKGRLNILEEKVDDLENKTGLKWLALGDSITEGYYSIMEDGTEDTESHKSVDECYCAWIAKMKGFELDNQGVGGSGWLKRGTAAAPKLNAREQIDATNEDGSYVFDFTKYDLCTIMWGVNDWKGSQNFGTFEDGINPTTESVIGNMRYVIETILTRNPAIKLILITPVNCCQDTSGRSSSADNNWGIGFTFGSGDNAKTLQDYYDAIKQVCEYYGVEMIDMLHSSVINRITARTMLPDKVHPSLEAHRQIGLELAGRILYGN